MESWHPNERQIPVIRPELLLEAYRSGIFPMAMPGGEIEWFSPDPRGIIPLDRFHVPHGLRRSLRKGRFEVRIDSAFRRVMEACATRAETWISPVIIESYCLLHDRGWAHSVECWRAGKLAGGLYGVAIGGAFFGESMFSIETDASKIALHALVERMVGRGFLLLDIQWATPHLSQFGCREISRRRYTGILREALAVETTLL